MELAEALRRRRMVRAFRPEPLRTDVLDGIVDAAGRAPSAGNSQGVDLVVLQGAETAAYWDASLPPERRARFRWQGLLDAPALIVVVADPSRYTARYAEPDKVVSGLGRGPEAWGVPFWHVDAGMAVMAMLLRVVDLGLGAVFFGAFERADAVASALGIPAGREVVGTVAVGRPVPDEPGRSSDRPRRADTVHLGRW